MHDDDHHDLPTIAQVGLGPVEIDWLQLTRLICSSYDRDEVRGFDAAMSLAEHRYGSEHGPTVAARIAALIRALRVERRLRFNYMSPSCPSCSAKVTEDELHLITLMRAGRMGDAVALETAVTDVAGHSLAPMLTAAAYRFGVLACAAIGGPAVQVRSRHLH